MGVGQIVCQVKRMILGSRRIWQVVRSGLYLPATRDKSINIWQDVRSGFILAAYSENQLFFGKWSSWTLYIRMVGFWQGTMIHSTLFPSFSTLQSGAPTSQNLRGRSAPTSQFLRGRSLWPLKNWEVGRPDLSVSERLAAPSWQHSDLSVSGRSEHSDLSVFERSRHYDSWWLDMSDHYNSL